MQGGTHATVDSQNISLIVDSGFCTGCGTCIAICPMSAIQLVMDEKQLIYSPSVNSAKCNRCGLCVRVCGGAVVDFEELGEEIFGDEPVSHSVLLGDFVGCYYGHSEDYGIRVNSSSGGMVTQLLTFALEEGLIDGALVCKMQEDNPLEPMPFVARSAQEINEASKSKYRPVPANIALDDILRNRGKYAVVGLPCHIHALRKAEKISRVLKERIVLHFGLFCSHTDSFLQTDYLLSNLGISRQDVCRLDYRGNGWPGTTEIELKTGKMFQLPYLELGKLHQSGFFIPERCLLCCDHCAELADTSFGDAWLPQFVTDKLGTSLVISRIRASEELLMLAASKGIIRLKKIDALDVARSQGMVRFKKNGFEARSDLFRLRGRRVPIYKTKLCRSDMTDWIRSILVMFNRHLGLKRIWGINGIIKVEEELAYLVTRQRKLFE